MKTFNYRTGQVDTRLYITSDEVMADATERGIDDLAKRSGIDRSNILDAMYAAVSTGLNPLQAIAIVSNTYWWLIEREAKGNPNRTPWGAI